MSIYRNTRTANGLKRGVRVEWDAPKPKKTPKPKFDPLEFLKNCAADDEAYSDKERLGFRKAIDLIESLKAEIAAHDDDNWNSN